MELKAIAAQSHSLTSHTVARMQKTPVLLAFQRKQASGKAALLDDEEREMIPVGLKTADQIIIADDTNAMQLFGDSLFTAPQDNTLEDFYFSLGSPRLSSLVKEDPKHTDEVQNSKQAAEIRNLILERLPLFLHEHTHAKTRLSYKWLKTGNNFLVKSFGKVSITKQLNHGDLRLSQAQDASAVSYRPRPEGSLELWLAGNTQIDMYEVAMSFNRYFFDAPKANDTLLLMTLLSSDLRSLKRRGYNVDRILREQDAQRQAIREAQIKAALEKEKEEADNQPPVIPPPLPPINDKVPALASDQEVAPVSSSPKRQSTKMKNWGQKLKNITHSGPGTGKDASAPGPPPLDRTSRPPIQHNPTQGATPLQNIAANIDMAIQGCRPEAGNLIQNREQMQRVKESLDEGYCDVSGRVGDLKEIGKMGGVKVYLSYDVPRPEMATFMSEKRDSIARLVHLMMLLSQIYNVPVTNLHIFHDQGGGLIAFNRNGSIFFNLRYFIAWHDEEVARNELKTALISWYFTLAHEIAHNLVQPHNSEHEFYFSALCEKHLMNLGAVLATL
ncbi:hypothetical protein PQX77_010295 [Marasmius sp. AFHP31]|nr:hypothetical protein PQX77_010295 [Marasmius sp. AFHP31]